MLGGLGLEFAACHLGYQGHVDASGVLLAVFMDELARGFEKVTGLDFSSRFFRLAARMQEEGSLRYALTEEGEIASPGNPVYTIHNLQRVWARVDVEETDIGRIRLGDKAIVLAGALPDRRFEGEIIEIGQEGEFATQRDVSRGRQDIRTFRVKVLIKKPEGLLKPGMTVVVIFR